MLIAPVFLAFLLDIVLGEPKRYHPLVGFGYLATKIESAFNRAEDQPLLQFLYGALSWGLLVLIPTFLVLITLAFFQEVMNVLFNSNTFFGSKVFFNSNVWWTEAIILYLAVGYTSLRQHALAVFMPLSQNHITQAREQVARIVSRDTDPLECDGIRKATIESVLENGSDAIFSPLFWFIVGGIPGVIIYRLSNTLDAMWGYKTKRFLVFGRFSAKMDDALNWLPSRLVGLSYALLGQTRQSLQCWLQQSSALESPNGGVVMTAGAGALSIQLGGDASYSGQFKHKITFGCGNAPTNSDITKSLNLVTKTLLLWLSVIVVCQLVFIGVPS